MKAGTLWREVGRLFRTSSASIGEVSLEASAGRGTRRPSHLSGVPSFYAGRTCGRYKAVTKMWSLRWIE